ncbi:MAG: tetratricopeptide repeat protein [Rickettsiales bacterium]
MISCTTALAALASPAFAAFDPQINPTPSATSSSANFDPQLGAAPSALPDTRLLNNPRAATARTVGAAPLPVAPLYPTHAIAMPSAPVSVAAAPVVAAAAPNPAFPPVDPAIAAQAQQELRRQSASQAAAPTVQSGGFIAPAPLITLPQVAPTKPEPLGSVATAAPVSQPALPALSASPVPAPVIVAAPVPTPSPVIAAAPVMLAPPPAVIASTAPAELAPVVTPLADPLSTQSKTILSRIPSKLDTTKPGKTTKLALERVSPEVADVLGADAKDAAYESVGLSIKVRRPGLDVNFELNRAYTALMGGDTDTAIQVYKNIISTQPTNQDALFGLAATYHRLGDIEKARPIYGALLKLNPNHREGLNNFLALISDESPQEALAELERLEQRNPDFSPIPAQEAILLDKLGYVEESRTKMLRAIQLAPDNLTYKYNLAVMSDRNGQVADASALYRLLIDASLHGAKTPAPLEELQKRLNFITSVAAADGRALGG